MIKIPSQLGYKQTNRSDTLGSLWSTMGIDLQSNLGKVRVSPRLRINSQVSDLADLGVPVAFKYYSGAFRAVAGTRTFNGGATPNAVFTLDASSGFASDYTANSSDMEVFNGRLWASTTDELLSNGSAGTFGTWTTRGALSAGLIHILRFFAKFNRLYVTNGTTVLSVDTSDVLVTTGDYSVSLQFGQVITSMAMNSSYVWIGTSSKDVSNGMGAIVKWDGISSTALSYPMTSRGIFALANDPARDVIYAMDANGALLKYNGAGFSEVGRLPYTNHLPFNPDGVVSDRFIHPNGLSVTKNDTVLALINNLNNDNGATIEENIPSGLWEWSEENGFVHRQSFSYNIVGNATITDYGQNRISRVGALANVNLPSTTAGRNGTIMAGATIYTDATTTTNAIFINDSLDTIQKAGYFVTTKIFSDQVEDTWQKFFVRHKKLLDSGDIISVKYRTSEEAPVEATITWTTTTTFTTTTDVSAYTNYEVEVLQGKGSGKTAKITTIVNNAGTYTVTVDSVFTGATSGTAKARFQKWIQLGTQTSQAQSYFETQVNRQSTWIQFKVALQFKGTDEVDDHSLSNQSHKDI